jgi:hypothetical protein
MFGTIRKHQTWLWAVIITLTVISFVVYFSPYTRTQRNEGRRGNYGTINGEPVTQQDLDTAARDVYLLYFFFISGGHWPDDESARRGFDVTRESYQWLLLLQEQERLGIHISDEAVTRFARELISGTGASSSSMFVEKVLKPRFDLEDFERFVRHFLGRRELVNTVGTSGKLFTPQEAKEIYIREHQELATQAVFFSVSNYLASVTATPEAISQFYSNQLANYRIPDRVQVSYVKFGVSNYLAQAQTDLTNLTDIVKANFDHLGTNYVRYGKTPDEAKATIRQEILRQQAMALARKDAVAFATPLFEMEPMRAENLEQMAKAKGLKVAVTPPFDREEGPKDLEVGADFVRAAFSRTPAEPLNPPIIGQDGVYVIAFNKKLPSEIPTLDQIRDRVVGDYKYYQAVMKTRMAGMEFYRAATNGLAQGKTFSAVCTNNGYKVVDLPPFSLSTRALPEVEDHINLNSRNGLKQLAFGTQPGKVSNFQDTSEGGVIVFVKAKLPLEDSKVQANLPSFMRGERQRREEEAFGIWFNKEASTALRDVPALQPKQPPPNMRSGPAKS